MKTLNSNRFEGFALLFQKVQRKSFLNSLQYSFFQAKIASKLFPKMVPLNNFGFKQFLSLPLALPENCFNFATQKPPKKQKMSPWNPQSNRFLPQGKFKTIF